MNPRVVRMHFRDLRLRLAVPYGAAAPMTGIVLIEVIVLGFNDWRCPLTAVAGRYTGDGPE